MCTRSAYSLIQKYLVILLDKRLTSIFVIPFPHMINPSRLNFINFCVMEFKFMIEIRENKVIFHIQEETLIISMII